MMPMELMAASPPAAPTPDRKEAGMVQKTAAKDSVPASASDSAATRATGSSSSADASSAAPPTRLAAP